MINRTGVRGLMFPGGTAIEGTLEQEMQKIRLETTQSRGQRSGHGLIKFHLFSVNYIQLHILGMKHGAPTTNADSHLESLINAGILV